MPQTPVRMVAVGSGSGTTVGRLYEETQPGGILHGLVQIAAFMGTMANMSAFDLLVNELKFPKDRYVYCSAKKLGPDAWGRELIQLMIDVGANALGLHGCLAIIPEFVINWCRINNVFDVNQHPAIPKLIGGDGWYGERVFTCLAYLVELLNRPMQSPVVSQRVHAQVDQGEVFRYELATLTPGMKMLDVKRALIDHEYDCQINAWKDVALDQVRYVEPPSYLQPGEEWALEEAKRRVRAEFKF